MLKFAGISAERSRGWQFSLWELFALMTFVALATALAVAYGPGTLLNSFGLMLAWLNMRGAFQGLQQGGRQRAILGLAWVMFLGSLALPAIKIFGPVSGVSAAWFALMLPVESLWKHKLFRGLPIYVAINIASGLMFLLPLIIWRLGRGKGLWLSSALCAAMPVSWSFAWNPNDLLVGYYVWSISFWLALVGIPVRPRLLIVMVVMAAVLPLVIGWDLG